MASSIISRWDLAGPGLIRAYDLEDGVAVYPRIVVDDSVTSLLSTWSHQEISPGVAIPNTEPWVTLKRDHDGVWFIDVFQKLALDDPGGFEANFAKVHDLVERRLSDSEIVEQLQARAKWLWFANQVNGVLDNPGYWGVYGLKKLEVAHIGA